jgi:TatD DNase family protein
VVVEWIDTHAHLYASAFDEDRTAVIQRALAAGVKEMYLPNINRDSFSGMMQLCDEFPGKCFPMIGLHPCDVKEDYEEILEEMEGLLKKEASAFVAIGETGLDFYWDKSTAPIQERSLLYHLQWCRRWDLPVVLHARDSLDYLIEMMSSPENKGLEGVFHCFTGDLNQAERILGMGFYLGIGGVSTFKNGGLDKVLPHVPLSRIVLETDAPYLAPVPYRGKRNESAYLPIIAQKVSALTGQDLSEVSRITTEAARELFRRR